MLLQERKAETAGKPDNVKLAYECSVQKKITFKRVLVQPRP